MSAAEVAARQAAPVALVSARGLEKSFGPTRVLKGVDFTICAGEIHALLGGNGAGKSTMIRIITGQIRRDGGEIAFRSQRREQPVISVVHQELALLPDLSVAENIGLVHAASGLSPHRARHAAQIAQNALMLIDPHLAATALHRKAASLSLHESQIVEIARALSTGAEVLLLDEPTANLTAVETERLFEVLRKLARDDGMGIVFVSHRMKEIRQLCDVCTIIRDGQTAVDRQSIALLSDTQIVQQMGQPAHRPTGRPVRSPDAEVALTLLGPQTRLEIAAGTILGLAGSPTGPSGLISALIGAGGAARWQLKGAGWPEIPASPQAAVRAGIGYVSGDRAAKGVLSQLPIIDNLVASRRVMERRRFFGRRERDEAAELVKALKVKIGSVWDLPGTLSGGNQQKLLIARWLGLPLRMVVLEEPTRGVDIGTKREIYALIREMAAQGTIIVWWSTENVELLEICDQILAFDTEGTAKGLLPDARFDEDALAELTGMAA
ncbi:sugar ABC transporter ATP-binding protein [Thioclava sp. BHET1]|nr:sugar ABC transporter ATP-binding protein [Thioclava sp. BHET1]